MLTCFVLFAEPGGVFQGIHRTADGAVHRAAALGATHFEDGSELSIEGVAEKLDGMSSVTLRRTTGDEFSTVRIERHGINV